jgi:filamentous hemagglutinin family protein
MKLESASKLRRRVATLRPVVAALMGAGCMSCALADNLPTGMTLKAGGADIATNGSTMTATQTTRRAVWEAFNFSIGEGFTFVNNGPSGSLTLVRVTGAGQRSQLDGTLTANNTFMLVNPYGIYVGGTAVITAGNLLLSAKDLRPDLVKDDPNNPDAPNTYNGFMNATHLVFNTNAGNSYGDSTIDISKGAQINATANGGSIYLVADNVRNQGTLTAGAGGEIDLLAVSSAGFDVKEVQVGDSGFITLESPTYINYDYAATPGYGQDFTNRVAINTGSIEAPNGTVKMVGVGASGQSNRFDDIDSQDADSRITTALYQSGVDGSYGSGAFNSGTIKAAKASLVAQGPGSIAAVTGTVTAKAIAMSGETVRVGLHRDADGQLIADTPEGGGTIDLGDTARLEGDATNTKWIYVSGAAPGSTSQGSTLSASATDNGPGGKITLRAMYADGSNTDGGTPQARYNYGQIEAYGNFIAKGGPNSTAGKGAGGKVEITGQQVNLSYNGMKARFLVAPLTLGEANGEVSVTTPYVNIGYDGRGYGSYGGDYGGHYEPSSGDSWIDPDVITDTLQGGANISIMASADGHNTLFGDSYMYSAWGVQIGSSGAGARKLVLQSDNDIYISGNTSITAFAGEGGDSGPLEIQMVAKNGGLSLNGQDGQNDSEFAPVTIKTNGGNVTLNGSTSTFVEGPSAGVYISGSNIDASGTGGQGLLTINGTGAAQTGVWIQSSTPVTVQGQPAQLGLTGNHVSITGVSQTGTGVSLSDTTVTATTGIEVHGLSQQAAPQQTERVLFAAAASPQAVQSGAAGVDIGPGVVLNGGQGNVVVLGRSASGDGVRIQDLNLISAVGAARPRITIAGESTGDGMGVNVLQGGTGIHMQDQQGPVVASTAEVVIGGTAASGQDIELGTPVWNTTGSVNIRPLSVGQNFELADKLNKPIRVGTTVSAGEFLIKPEWFNATANGNFASSVAMVLGSSNHVGKITVEDNALDGAGNVTLQNQGQGSGGIELGRQDIIAETLNLVTAGNITQTGPIMVNQLRVITGTGATVALNNAQNLINGVSTNNQPPGVAPAGVAAQASLANTDSSGIITYDQSLGQFRPLSITNYEVPREPTPIIPPAAVHIPRPFDGPDTLNDLRTDVYVHGQLSRPQICTAANTSGGAVGVQGGAEPLALEWVKVKRSAQLSNCSGVQTDSSCSAF